MVNPKDFKKKYPRAVLYLKEHPYMTIDEAIKFLEQELEIGKI